ncbi:hypothetical protein [Actinomadura kijaniata]|uniref:hypothetical protein n=1 Tax=Actinomadura kijaniata TaxID=46161 RepID=UPI000830834B|nr:hypothetical protein [Actinomadura kijaniata]
MSTNSTRTRRDPWRVGAVVGLVTLLPVTALAWIHVLSTETFGRCLTYGETCDPAADTWLPVAWWAFWGSAAAGIVAVALPRRVRTAAVVRPVLVTAQATLQAMVFASVVASA